MSLSFFEDKAEVPKDDALVDALRDSKVLWDEVFDYLTARCANVNSEWKYYSKKAGWSLVVKSNARTLIYLIPLAGSFKASFVLGEKAFDAALFADLPTEVVKLITQAVPYVEGRSFMVDVETTSNLEVVKKLLQIKIDN